MNLVDSKLPTTRPGNFWKRVAVVFVALAALSLILEGAITHPAGEAEGTSLHFDKPPAVATKNTIKLATWNIRRGVGMDNQLDLARIAKQIEPMDIVGLNEVAGGFRSSQAEIIGQDNLSRGWLFAPSERRWWHDSFGNAMIARLPAKQWRRLQLPPAYQGGKRCALLATYTIEDETGAKIDLTVIITHTDWKEGRDAQLKEAINLFLNAPAPAVLMGDLNSTEKGEPRIRELLSRPDVSEALRTLKKDEKGRSIDWIFTRGLEMIDSGMHDAGESDHPLLWAEVKLKPSSEK